MGKRWEGRGEVELRGPMETNPGSPGIQSSMLGPCSRQTIDVLMGEDHQNAISMTEVNKKRPVFKRPPQSKYVDCQLAQAPF